MVENTCSYQETLLKNVNDHIGFKTHLLISILGPVRQAATAHIDVYQYTGIPEKYMLYTESELEMKGTIGIKINQKII